MNKGYIQADIYDLITKLLQAYFELEIATQSFLYPGSLPWRQRLEKRLEHHKTIGDYPKAMSNAKNDIDSKGGIANYQISDMDITIIFTFHCFPANKKTDYSLYFKCPDKLMKYMEELNDIRNDGYAHVTTNETTDEVYDWAISSLKTAEDFVKKFNAIYIEDKRINTKEKDRAASLCADYTERIDKLRERIRAEYKKDLDEQSINKEIEKDIKQLKDHPDNLKLKIAIVEKYSFKSSNDPNFTKYIHFTCKAADSGLNWALPEAGNISLFISKNYNKAEEYYSMLFTIEKPFSKEFKHLSEYIDLASIYLNGKSIKHSVSDGQKMIDKFRDEYPDFIISKSTDSDGFERYAYSKKVQLNSDRKPASISKSSSSKMMSRKTKLNTIVERETEGNNRPRLTVGSVSGSKKMRLGRDRTKKTNSSTDVEQK